MNKYNKIDWQTGMEITPQVLNDADNFHIEQRNLIRRLQVMPYYGLLPDSNCNADINFDGTTVIIRNLVIHAITPQGELINKENAEEDVSGYIKDSLVYLDNTFGMPIAKINNNMLDGDYIPPCISINSHRKLVDIYTEICEKITKIIEQIKEQQEKYKALFLPLSLLELELKNYSKFEAPEILFVFVKKIALLFNETLELESAGFINETYYHADIYATFDKALQCLRELEDTTKVVEEVRPQRIKIGVK